MVCPEEDCGGLVELDREGDYVIYRCGGCATEWAKHASTADPDSRRELRLEAAGLPSRFRGLRFEQDDENKSAMFVVRAWLSDFGKGVPLPAPAIWGRQGRGKSHMLTALCEQLVLKRDAQVMFTSVRGLLRELQRFEDEATRSAVWERARSVQVLALDDLGAERITDWRLEQVAELVDARYEAERPVLVATNFAPRMWDEVVDVRTASRLTGMCFGVELRGRDRRQTTIEGEAV